MHSYSTYIQDKINNTRIEGNWKVTNTGIPLYTICAFHYSNQFYSNQLIQKQNNDTFVLMVGVRRKTKPKKKNVCCLKFQQTITFATRLCIGQFTLKYGN